MLPYAAEPFTLSNIPAIVDPLIRYALTPNIVSLTSESLSPLYRIKSVSVAPELTVVAFMGKKKNF